MLLPVQTASMAELRETLADSFCNDRRLATSREEIPRGGSGAPRRPQRRDDARALFPQRGVSQLHSAERVACTVDEWLKNSDAASILYQWYGSIEAVVEKLIADR